MAQSMRVIVLLSALCVAVVSGNHAVEASNPPGMRVAVTNPGLTELKDIALPIINAALQDLTLPNINLDEHVPVVGHITLDLSNIKLTGFKLPDARLAVSSPPTFTMDMSGLTMEISMDYQWRRVHWPHVSDHGSITAEPQGGDISLSMSIATDGGHVVLTATQANVDFSGFTIHFHGKVSWLYNLFVDLFKNTIKDSVESAVKKQLMSVVDSSLDKALAKLPLSDTLGGGKSRVNVGVGMVSVAASSDYLSLGDQMSVSNNMTGAACPIVPHDLPNVTPGAGGSMLQLLLDDSFINCISWVATTNGALTVTLTDATLPKNFPLRLNTSAWGKLIPELESKYPNRPMQLLLSPKSPPDIATATTGVVGAMDFAMNFSVVTTAGPIVPVFTFDAGIALGLDVHPKMLNNTPVLVFVVTELNITLGVDSSTVGTINLAPIQGLFNTFAPLIKDLLNAFLHNGIPLPSVDGLELVGPTIEFDSGFMAIATNFTFNPLSQSPPTLMTKPFTIAPSVALREATKVLKQLHLRGSRN